MTPCERRPLCDAALTTNRELAARVSELETRIKRTGGNKIKARLTACEVELRERDASPWVYLPWKGFVT